LNKPRLNREWHLKHKMPANPTLEQRLAWHVEHAKHCACRPLPEKLLEEARAKGLVVSPRPLKRPKRIQRTDR
jgi:hypothetical protein